MSDATTAKVVSMVILGVLPLLLGVLPWLVLRVLDKRSRLGRKDPPFQSPLGRLVTSILLCFGGGVLLCTTFFHMQPEVTRGVHALQEMDRLPQGDSLHLPEIFLFAGFFFVYLVEELAHAWMHGGVGATEDAMHRTVGARRCSGVSQKAEACDKDSCHVPCNSSSDLVCPVREHHGHVRVVAAEAGSLRASLAGLLAVLALSFHAVFEGLAVGLESEAQSVWVMCGAIAAHKLVIALCVGVELATAGTRPVLLVLYVSTFALVTPLGIGAGTAVSAASAATATSSVEVVVLQGMASGTLVYVVFFEVLQRGAKREGEEAEEALGRASGLAHLLAVLAGSAVMYGLLCVAA